MPTSTFAAPARPSLLRRALRFAGGVAGLALLALVVATPLDLRTQAVFACGIFGLALLLGRLRGRGATLLLIVVSLTVSARYMAWRLTHTLATGWSLDAVLSSILLGAELYSFAMLGLGYLQSMWPLERKPIPLPADERLWPTVDVFIPTYDEPLEIVRATVLAAQALDWPREKLEIHLLDDGRRPAFRDFAAEVGVHYVTRTGNAHAKAGNLNHALARTRGEFVAIFDCDHVPTRAFLQLTMGWPVRDRRIALVQTPHHFYTPDPFERNLRTPRSVPNESHLFYGLIQRGNDLWNAAFFCGSCAVLRRSALEDVGGVAVETVTEDAHTALRMHRRGWRTAYLDVPLAAGLATETLGRHIGQRVRWARGMAQIFRIENPLVASGLGLWQRLCYAGAMLHFFSAVPRLVFLVAPAAYLLFDRHVFNAAPLVALAYAMPHLAHVVATNSRIQGPYRQSLWSEVYDSVLAPYTALPTTLALVAPRRGKFGVTAKGGRIDEAFFDARLARPTLLLAALNLACIGVGAWRIASGHPESDAMAINLVWALHNAAVLLLGLAVAYEGQQTRESPRLSVKLPAVLQTEDDRAIPCETADLAQRGARLLVPAGRTFAAGERVWISMLLPGRDELPLPAEVVGQDAGGLRVRFEGLGLAEQAALTEALFSRADAWRAWAQRASAHPVLAALEVVWRAFRRLFDAVRPLDRRARPALPTPEREALRRATADGLRRLLLALLVGGAALAAALPARAAAPAPRDPAEELRAVRAMQDLGPSPAQREASSSTLRFPLAVRSDRHLQRATVEIGFDPAERPAARLEILLNGTVVGALDTDRVAREREVHQVELPGALLGDRNLLALRIATPGADEGCPLPRGSWRFVRSLRVAQTSAPLPLPDDLALLPLPFVDRELDDAAAIPVVLPADPTPDRARLAALVASWFGVHNGLPLRFPVHLGALPDSRAVVLVDGADAAAALGLDAPRGPEIRMMDHPAHRGSSAKLLVLGGRDLPELEGVVRSLAASAVTLAGDRVAPGAPPLLPPSRPYDAPRFVPSGREVPFGAFPGVDGLALEGTADGSVAVRFRVAPDLWLWPREDVALDLGYEVSSTGDVGTPRLDLELNGAFLATLPVPPAGVPAGRVRLAVPRDLLRGFNELRLHVSHPDLEGRCGAPSGTSRVAIARDSVLHLEALAHFASLPDVSLFVYDGFPFTRHADLSQTALVLPDRPRPEELATALSLVSQLGAITGRVATGLSVVAAGHAAEARALDRDLLVVGLPADHALLRRWAGRLPIALATGGSRVRVPSGRGLMAVLNPISLWEELHRAEPVVARARDLAAVVGLESPLAAGRTAVVVTATAPQRMPSSADLLGFAEARGHRSDLLVVADEGRWMFRIGPSYAAGQVDPVTRVRWTLSGDWLLLVPALLAGAALIAVPARRGLAARAAARLAQDDGAEAE